MEKLFRKVATAWGGARPVNSATWGLRQENQKFTAKLGNSTRPCLKTGRKGRRGGGREEGRSNIAYHKKLALNPDDLSLIPGRRELIPASCPLNSILTWCVHTHKINKCNLKRKQEGQA